MYKKYFIVDILPMQIEEVRFQLVYFRYQGSPVTTGNFLNPEMHFDKIFAIMPNAPLAQAFSEISPGELIESDFEQTPTYKLNVNGTIREVHMDNSFIEAMQNIWKRDGLI